VRLINLEPRWFCLEAGGARVGLTFDCPHCLAQRLGVAFHRQGHAAIEDVYIRAHHGGNPDGFIWELNSGEDFENLTLTPSIDASKSGHWHGFISGGEVT
jgi:hypothetical protein